MGPGEASRAGLGAEACVAPRELGATSLPRARDLALFACSNGGVETFWRVGPSLAWMKPHDRPSTAPRRAAAVPEAPVRDDGRRLDRLILVYDGDRGIGAALLDAVKKAVGREDCALCEITHGPLGKRRAWRACEARLGVAVDELHRDELPDAWGISRRELPCVLGRLGDAPPFVLVSRAEIGALQRSTDALEATLRAALARHGVAAA